MGWIQCNAKIGCKHNKHLSHFVCFDFDKSNKITGNPLI